MCQIHLAVFYRTEELQDKQVDAVSASKSFANCKQAELCGFKMFQKFWALYFKLLHVQILQKQFVKEFQIVSKNLKQIGDLTPLFNAWCCLIGKE